MTEGEERVLLTEPEADSAAPTPAPAQPQNEEQVEEDTKLETLSQKLERFAEEAEEDTESVYKPPTEDPYTKAVKYMEMHNVMQIFQHLTSEIVYHRPVDPLNYMLEELQRMKTARDEGGEVAS
ncbi:hypothetical protein HOLleu_07521 [Holothuria leucospilota]|uniref:Uncharacterized protein n=1 Tax=Holothuria leucospilota TaxID=206669 RepID=A0A9Q1CHG9_HOLLE|nr:hypothetical protein HOLleu_07521 [Holothuria leucospilota]